MEQIVKPNQNHATHRLDHNLGFLINGLARLMRNMLEVRLHDTNLSPTTWMVLMALGEEDGQKQTGLSRRTFLDGATITRTLDHLEELDYIARHRDVTDRRAQLVVLTDAGKKAYKRAVKFGTAVNEEATAEMSESEKDRFEGFVHQIIDRMRNYLNNGVNHAK